MIANLSVMEKFEYKTIYAENLVDYKLPSSPYGVVNDKPEVKVVPAEVVLGKDDSSPPNALSLPKNSFIKVNFGDNVIVDGPGNDIELMPYLSGKQLAKFEFDLTTVFTDGTVSSKFVKTNRRSGNPNPVLINLSDFYEKQPVDVFASRQKEVAFASVSAIKITGLDDSGTSEGFEVYEVKGINGVSNQDIADRIQQIKEDYDPITGQTKQGIIDKVKGSVTDILDRSGDGNLDINDLDTNGDNVFTASDFADLVLLASFFTPIGISFRTGQIALGVAKGISGALGVSWTSAVAQGLAGGGFTPFGYDIGLGDLDGLGTSFTRTTGTVNEDFKNALENSGVQ